MDNEVLKATVLAKGRELAPTNSFTTHTRLHGEVILTTWPSGVQTIDRMPIGQVPIPICILDPNIPANHDMWWIAAKLLEIPTEMPIELIEAPMAIAQHYHELREAHDHGHAHGDLLGDYIPLEQSWEAFIGDYGKEEIKRTGQRAVEATDNLREGLAKLEGNDTPITFIGVARGKTWGVNDSEQLDIDCGEFGMVRAFSAVKEKGKPIHQMYCHHVRITLEQITMATAEREYKLLGGNWIEQS